MKVSGDNVLTVRTWKGSAYMIVRTTFKERGELTEEEKKMLRDLENRPIEFDEDCPEITEEQLKKFYRVRD